MSVTILRDAFNGISQLRGIRCIKVRMYYGDVDGIHSVKRDHQIMEFDIVDAKGARTIKTKPIPNGKSLVAEAMKLAANTEV